MSSVITPVTFVRVNEEPLDIYDKFNNISEAKTYAKDGPSYDGQRIIVKLDKHPKATKESFMLCEIIDKSLRIINFLSKGNTYEPIIKIFNNKTWLLLYSYNQSLIKENKYFDYNTISVSLSDNYKYSIAGCCELFRDNNKQFEYCVVDYAENITKTEINSNYNIVSYLNNDNEISDLDKENSNICITNGSLYSPTDGNTLPQNKIDIFINISEFV